MKCILSIVLLLLLYPSLWAQQQQNSADSSGLYNHITRFPDKLFQKIDEKTAKLNEQLSRQADKYLSRLARQEERLRKQLARKDSLAAEHIFADAPQRYAALQSRIKNVSATASRGASTYLPHLDSLQTAFQFLQKNDGVFKQVPGVQQHLQEAMGKMGVLQNKFTQAEQISRFVQDRQRYLQQQLSHYKLSAKLMGYQKQVYYYREQLKTYKQLYSDPGKLEAKVLAVLSKTPKFREFFASHSQLAGLFRLAGTQEAESSQNVIPGLQTRVSVQQQLQQHFGSGVDVQQVASQHMQGAQRQLGELRGKLAKKVAQAGINSNNEQVPVPGFKPNGQKMKSFLQRLEWGANLQTVKANRFFPSTTDVGLSLGYKLNDKSVVGVGGSYRMGWGKNIRRVSITHQGAGVRTYLDYQLKGSLWVSGGGEMNYRSAFSGFDVLRDYSAWQKSALVGVSKKYQVSSKMKGNMQLLYDVLWKQQIPRTQPLIFRLGYGFK